LGRVSQFVRFVGPQKAHSLPVLPLDRALRSLEFCPPSQDDAKQLCAALATSGGVSMCHIIGITPEAPTLAAAFQDDVTDGFISFAEDTLRETYRSLRNHTGDEIDSVILGCPHASIREIAEFAALLRSRHVAPRGEAVDRYRPGHESQRRCDGLHPDHRRSGRHHPL
jgi:predicted aconitase